MPLVSERAVLYIISGVEFILKFLVDCPMRLDNLQVLSLSNNLIKNRIFYHWGLTRSLDRIVLIVR
jgi:hypothetical protein